MSTNTGMTTAIPTRTVPRVNLLPPEIEEQRHLRQVQAGLGAGVAAALLVVAGGWVVAQHGVSSAQGRLLTSQAEGARLQQEAARYADVPLVTNQLAAAQAARGEAMGQEVRWSQYLTDLSETVPKHVWLTSLAVTQVLPGAVPSATSSTPATSTAAVPGAGVAAPAGGIGTVTVAGKALQHRDVATWLDAVARMERGTGRRHTEAVFTKSERVEDDRSGRVVVDFGSAAGLTEANLSHRYDADEGS